MVDRYNEVLRIVKDKRIWRILLPEYKEREYKEKKKEYFSDLVQKGLGLPKDSEIAKAVVDQLFRLGFFQSKDHLNKTLQTPFFSKNIVKEHHEDYLKNFKDPERSKSKDELNLGNIEKQAYKIRMEESKEELKNITQESEQKNEAIAAQIGDKRNEAEVTFDFNRPLPDQQADIQKPLAPEEREIQRRYEPWWRTLGLVADPFPISGLGNIKDSMYDSIIVFTELYNKYVSYINDDPTELFKNIVLYGDFGSGKTTLFEYLKMQLFRRKVYPAVIKGVPAEPDYQNFLIKLKLRLRRELINIFEIVGGLDITTTLDSMSLEDSICHLLKLIEQKDNCNGFVIFIDDIYKPDGYEKTGLKFLNHLQTFRDELTQEMSVGNIGFFISAPLEWEIPLKKRAYSGSISLEEHIPPPTIEQARAAFNQRLAAFAADKEKYRMIGQSAAEEIYQTLKSRNGSVTFRDFINECKNKLQGGKFDILTSNPLTISREILDKISLILKGIPSLDEKINGILELSISNRDKGECLDLLIDIYNKKGLPEASEAFHKKRYYFDILKGVGLVTKTTDDHGGYVWNVSNDLSELSQKVRNKFDYYLDDYFLRLFEGKIELKKIELGITDTEELILIQKLIDHFRDMTDEKSRLIHMYLRDAQSHHKQIIKEMNELANRLAFNRLTKYCNDSIKSISNAMAKYADMEVSGSGFWDDYWQYPESLRNFNNVFDKQRQSYEPNTTSLYSAYEYAFTDIVKLFSDQVAKDKYLPIPYIDLKVEEVKEFDAARTDYIRPDLFAATKRITTIVENKLREFIYSVFLLQYGDFNSRTQRIPIKIKCDVMERRNREKAKGVPLNKNEITSFNRFDYLETIASYDTQGIGYDNWVHSFSKIFTRLNWNLHKIRSYLNTFQQFHLKTSHNNPQAFINYSQPEVYQFIMDSIKIIILINTSYFLFLEQVKKAQIHGSTEIGYYFYLNEGTLQPVRISDADRERIIELFKESKLTSIDLSCPSIIEERFRINYQGMFAILSDLVNNRITGLEMKIIKRNDPIINFRMN